MFDRFTDEARKVMFYARHEANDLGHDFVDSVHILLGITRSVGSEGAELLLAAGIDHDLLRSLLPRREEPKRDTVKGLNHAAMRALDIALESASSLRQDSIGTLSIGTLHLLKGILEVPESTALALLNRTGLDVSSIPIALAARIESSPPPVERLSSFITRRESRDWLVDLSDVRHTEGTWERVGRFELLERLTILLSRRHHPNVALVGHPGVGKTTLIEMLGEWVGKASMPGLFDARLVKIELGRIQAYYKAGPLGARVFATILAELRRARKVVLVLEDVRLLGDPDGMGSPLSYVDALRATLDAEDLRCITTATPDAWNDFRTQEPGLASRFQVLEVPPTTLEESRRIAFAARDAIGNRHRVHIGLAAIEATLRVLTDLRPQGFTAGDVLSILTLGASTCADRLRGQVTSSGRSVREVESWDLAVAIELFKKRAEA